MPPSMGSQGSRSMTRRVMLATPGMVRKLPPQPPPSDERRKSHVMRPSAMKWSQPWDRL
uniref:Uncharacterized protein n=1 Tax=Arundo donax TaxID=35708 RepID=A0A0A9DX40_ARUDO